MNNKEMALRLREDTKYQEFFRAALAKFGEKTPADMTDEEKKKFFKYVEDNWTTEDPATDDGDVSECDTDDEEEMLRATIRKEIASALRGDTLEEEHVEEEVVQEKNIYHFKNMIRGGMINVNLANDKAASKYADRLGSRWQLVNIGEAVAYLKELQEIAERKACKKK